MHVGFLLLQELEVNDVFVGALLVTDESGVPIEFKCTHAIKPTLIQRALYGDNLRPFIGVTLCGVPLYQSLKNEPDVIFIKQAFCLNLHLEVNADTVLVSRAGESLGTGELSHRDRMNSEGGFPPIIVTYHPDSKKSENDEVRELISQVFLNVDVLEPFDRISKSIEVLGRNDPLYR
ncbi:hypothetical protein IC229_32060 [Spirosoma sp. BT702]|uniref:Uncharacterized protein n=1 Tax=Spirosoma profusum TaxID=2771354 RepID=A0A927AVQ8_9BACT|nr:hypothetical protein [Spirosoma profusum]MBD2705297.1 hypothetical protein [Spirosoma profusum]